jgi:hypothetical protein
LIGFARMDRFRRFVRFVRFPGFERFPRFFQSLRPQITIRRNLRQTARSR